jgi:formate C-acetyltransferase
MHAQGISVLEDTSTKRVKELRKRILDTPPSIVPFRDELVLKAYKRFAGEPIPVLRAKVLREILLYMPIGIAKGELIVGNLACEQPRAAGLFLEFSSHWIPKEIDRFPLRERDRLFVSKHTKEKFLMMVPFWEGRTVYDHAMAMMPPETKEAYQSDVFAIDLHLLSGLGHVALGYDKVIKKGFRGIIREICEREKSLNIANPEDFKRYEYLQALKIVCEAAIGFSKRYALLAKQLAENEKDPLWKADLLKIANICEWVPENPARSFHEALQSFFFCQLITQIESDGTAVSPGRLDYFTYPYYKADFEKGILTPDAAQELLDCVVLKLNEIIKVWNEQDSRFFAGFPISQNLCVGGLNRFGKDATNDVSYMLLQSLANIRLPQPAFSVRLHANSPEEFVDFVGEAVKLGLGMPALYNDESIIPAMMSRGISLEDARQYAIVGCVEPSVHGKDWPRANGGFFNLAKLLELALNNGVCRLKKKRIGPPTGDPRDFKSFDDLMKAFQLQMDYFLKHLVIINNIIDYAHAELAPLPFISSITDDCIEKCQDVTWGGAHYNTTGPLAVGLANVADSLAAVKKLVFEDRKLGMEELLKAIDCNFEGYEEIQQVLINHAPKYGNDDDYVDLIARDVARYYCDRLRDFKNAAGAPFSGAFIPVSSNVPLGRKVWATPDGRKAFQPLAEGVSPGQGRDKKGPTAVFNSVSKLDHESAPIGILLNQKINPDVLKGKEGTQKLTSLVKTFFQKKGQHVQFNVVSSELLRKAQQNPEMFPNLIVRVAGYSAFFNDLDKAVQDDIISRTEQAGF